MDSTGTITVERNEGGMPTFTLDFNNGEPPSGSFWDFVNNNTTSDKLTEFVDRAFDRQPELRVECEGSQAEFMGWIAQHPKLLEKFLWKEYCNHLSDVFMETFKKVEIKKPDEVPDDDTKSRKTVIPDDLYESFILQIHRLPQRKRNKWKESIRDKWGNKTEVRWRFNKLMENQGENGWIEVHSDTQMFGDTDNEKGYSTSPEGAGLMTKYRMKKAEGKHYNDEAIEEVYREFMDTCSRLRAKATQEGA